MGDLSKLKVAIGQPELYDANPSRNLDAQERMISLAVESGADVLVMPGSLVDAGAAHLIALNDSRIDVAGSVVMLKAAGESYRIGIGSQPRECDFAVFCDVEPWALQSPERASRPGIVMRPVGMRNIGHKVLAYDGGTSVHAADGLLIRRLRDDFEEDFALVSLAEAGEVAQPCQDKLLAALVKTVRRFDEQVLPFRPSWVIGLSGGLDSSVVAALLTLALGSDRVIGFNLASEFNSRTTRDNASAIAEALGIRMRSGAITDMVAATELVAESFGYGGERAALSGLVLENVQARVRGHLLSTFAALEGGVVVNNGNRVESAFGYATLYGDAIGAMAPIGDLVKTRLFDLARAVNGRFGCEVVPENLLPSVTDAGLDWPGMPSAELADAQRDPMKWFYHDWLVEQLLDGASVDTGACEVLGRYLDDRLRSSEVARWVSYYGLDDPREFLADFDWVMKSIRRSAFKRIQSPPVITVASAASIARLPEVQGAVEPSARYRELHARIAKIAGGTAR